MLQTSYPPVLPDQRSPYGGVTLYLFASIGCMLAGNAQWSIAPRFLQALGAAAASVLARAIVRDLFPLNEATRALSLMHLVTMIATLIAPLLGSYLIMISSWRSLFVVLFIFAVIVLFASIWKTPETHHGDSRHFSVLTVFKAYLNIAFQPVAVGYILCMSLLVWQFGLGALASSVASALHDVTVLALTRQPAA